MEVCPKDAISLDRTTGKSVIDQEKCIKCGRCASVDVYKRQVSMGVVRTTYLIDEQGIIIKANDKVKAADDPENMLKELALSLIHIWSGTWHQGKYCSE